MADNPGQFKKEDFTKPPPEDGTTIGGRIEFKMINASKLFIDNGYQRTLREGHVRSIARGFDPDQLDPLDVSYRGNDRYAVTDGQHRLEAIRMMGWGDQDLPCLVKYDMTPEDEAKDFSFQKNRRGLTRYDLHKSDLFAKEVQAVQVEQAVIDHGFITASYPGENHIQAIGALYTVASKFGIPELRYVLSIFRDAWTGDQPRANAIIGLAYFLSKFPEAKREVIVNALTEVSPTKFEMKVRGLRENFNNNYLVLGGYQVYMLYQKTARGKTKLPVWMIGNFKSDSMKVRDVSAP